MFFLMASGWVRTSKPATVPEPSVGASRPQSMRMVVLFPAPFGPRKPKISPRAVSKLTWSTAVNLPKRRVSPSTRTAGPSVTEGGV